MSKHSIKVILSVLLSMTLILSMTLTAFAETIINPDGTVTVVNTDSVASGNSVTVTITKDTAGTLADGTVVEGHSVETSTENYENGVIVSGSKTEDSYTKTTSASFDEEITVETIAAAADSFNYEFVCGISRRVPRIYSHSGKTVHSVHYLLDT